jgi:hypothetical protein
MPYHTTSREEGSSGFGAIAARPHQRLWSPGIEEGGEYADGNGNRDSIRIRQRNCHGHARASGLHVQATRRHG